nr:ribonuclease H-like domain-containing protein [Tanacetum cinerariifolium]
MNYSSWVYYFSHLCHGYGILDHLVDPVASSSTVTPTDPPPKDAERTKIDFIIRSWIFSTLAPLLRKRLVDLNPTTIKDAWTYIAGIFKDNKRPRAMALKAKLRNLKLGDLFIDRYFQKIESIVSILNGLGSPLSNDDVVTFMLDGLPSTYDTIFTVIISREPFPDLKTVRSLLNTHEMRLKSKVQNPLVDATSASPMVLLAKSNTSARRGPSLEKVNNLCWSFVKGSCWFGDACKYLHNDVHGKSTLLPRTSGLALSVPDGVQMLSGPPQGVHLVPGPSQPPVQFTTGVQQRQGGSFPSSVHLGQSPSMPFNPSQLFASGSQVGDGRFIPVTNSGHSVLSTPFRPLRLNNVLITPNIVKNLISVRQFVRDNSCTVEFDPFGFSVKDFITRWVLLCCDSTGSEVLRRLVSSDSISCNKEKLPVLCHACQLGKHVKLLFVSSSSSVTSCFDIVHSDLWTSPILSLSGF